MSLSRITSASIANSAISAADIADSTITAAKIISVANTQITGNIVSSQIVSVANTQITGNIVSSQIAPSIVLTTPALGTPASGVLTNCTGVPAALPAGSVLQVASTTLATTTSTTSTSFVDITGLSVSITPRSASNKILISASVSRGTSVTGITFFQFMRDSTAIGIADAAGSRVRSTMAVYFGNGDSQSHIGAQAMNYLDSPSTTSATTYKVQFRTEVSAVSYVNRNGYDGDLSTVPRAISTITVMEIQG